MSRLILVRRISGKSMEPALKVGKIVIAIRSNDLKVNNIVIVAVNNLEIIKRINQVKGNKVYILGDNSSYSTDSREFGWVKSDQILGKVVWPREV